MKRHIGSYTPNIALGLGLRHDWGPQYTANQFLAELKWLGMQSTPSFVGEPQWNGLIERFMRTLKEGCIYLNRFFASLSEAKRIIGEFIERYNREWMIERHDYKTPIEARLQLTREAA